MRAATIFRQVLFMTTSQQPRFYPCLIIKSGSVKVPYVELSHVTYRPICKKKKCFWNTSTRVEFFIFCFKWLVLVKSWVILYCQKFTALGGKNVFTVVSSRNSHFALMFMLAGNTLVDKKVSLLSIAEQLDLADNGDFGIHLRISVTSIVAYPSTRVANCLCYMFKVHTHFTTIVPL